jgi:hypothetical protein
MTAYIKNLRDKRKQWNGERVWATRPEVRARIESLPSFKAVQAEMDRGVAEVTQRLRDQKESDAKKQRWKTRTREEKGRECIDALAKTIKEHGEMGVNNAKSYDEARKKAEEIAVRHDKEVLGE